MTHALSFLLGCALIATVMLWRGKASRAVPRRRVPRLLPPPTLELPNIAVGVSLELATLASGIEGNAQLLCEGFATGDPSSQHAEHLCSAVQRLRTLSETIQFAVSPIVVNRQPTRIDDVLASTQHELASASRGRFHLTLDTASSVPDVNTDPRALRQVLILLAEVLLGRAAGADRLTLRSRNAIDESAHAVVVEMVAEVQADVRARPTRETQLALAHQAAANLLSALGAEWTLHVDDGIEAVAHIALPAAHPGEPTPAQPEASSVPAEHEFGGALVLASDPAVRYMIGQELERAGRQVFLCADGVGARTLWQATPERFELLVFEVPGGPMAEELVVDAVVRAPDTAVILLGRTDVPALTSVLADPRGRVALVPQPFGIMELRAALAHVGIESSRVVS